MNKRDDSSYELISAYLDGELTPDERARVEQLVASSDEHRQTLDALRTVAGGMRLLPSHHLDDAFSQRVVAAAREAGVSFDADTHQASPAAHARPSTHVWHWPAAVGLLVTAAVAALVAVLVWRPGADWPTSAARPRISQAQPMAEQAVADGSLLAKPTVPTPDPGERVEPSGPDLAQVATSPPGPAATAVDPSAASPNAAADVGMSVQRRQVPGQPPLPGDDERPPEQTLADVPFSGTQQLLLVIDVALTQQGLKNGAFDRTLATHGVAIEGTVPVNAELEVSLLASRFFEPAKVEPESNAAARADLALMYVKTQAGHVDEMWRAMQSHPSEFSAVALDMAFLADDQAMFQELRRTVDQQSAGLPPNAAVKDRARRAAGHRLALSPSWRGSPVTKLKGMEDLAGMVPDWMLGKAAGKKEPVQEIPGQPVPRVPLPPGGRLGENVDAEVLFVVHAGRIRQD